MSKGKKAEKRGRNAEINVVTRADGMRSVKLSDVVRRQIASGEDKALSRIRPKAVA